MRRTVASAATFAADPVFPSITVVAVDAPMLVLGSTQPLVSAPVPVVRRRSGGGAVALAPGQVAWVDVAVPAGHRLWHADVGRAFHWLGAVWSGVVGAGARWHDGPLVRTPLSDAVCFAGLGPGEVVLEGRKVVGIAQRRTRAGALFQCAALIEWDPSLLASVFDVDAASLRDVATGLAPRTVTDVESAFLAALPPHL